VSDAGPGLSVDEILGALAAGAERPLGPGVGVSLLDHALQTAALLARRHRGDGDLALAGLVHDIGHLLPGGTDENHATVAARAVRGALGERVAAVVALHVEAKRYLVATEIGYDGLLGTDSVVSLGRQGGALSEVEAAAFRARPWAADALALRRADDAAKVEGLEVAALAHWVPLLRARSADGGAPTAR
jgi:predicted HD phosphohydrolase